MNTSKPSRRGWGKSMTLRAAVPVLLAWCATDAHALPVTLADSQCMQERAGFSLNCTANDVSVAGVLYQDGKPAITITDPCSGVGDSVTFTAKFEVVLNAQERHDIGIYFSTDGDPNGDGALTSSTFDVNGQPTFQGCSASTLDYLASEGGVDLDGTSDPIPGSKKPSGIQDTCGDIDSANSPLYPEITVTAVCKDDDGDGFLDLPNCVSWRQSGANELCRSPADTFPGSPSKCKCDAGFDVPVPVPAKVSVKKEVRTLPDGTFNDTSVTLDEPGGNVEYRVTFKVEGSDKTPDVTINSMMDNPYGDITKAPGGDNKISSTTCEIPSAPIDGNDGSYQCTFQVKVVGNGKDEFPDTVTVMASDGVGNSFSPSDDAKVVLADVKPTIKVYKSADPTSVLEPGGDVKFSVTVEAPLTNKNSDVLTITTLDDDVHGDLNGQGSCATGITLMPGESKTCSFTAYVGGAPGYEEMDTVTVWAKDDEDNSVSDQATALVKVTDVPAQIQVTKTATPDMVDEGGDEVTFTVEVKNISTTDAVKITSLMDSIFGDLDGQGDCAVPQWIAVGSSYTCEFTKTVSGQPLTTHTNKVEAKGVDDDGKPVDGADTADVGFNDVPPAASLTKTVKQMLVTYEVAVFNDSEDEALDLNSLTDDKFGDVTKLSLDPYSGIQRTDCVVTQTIAIGGSYKCTFDAIVTTSPHDDTVTAEVDDDDAAEPVKPSDSARVTFGDVPPPSGP